MDARVLLWAGVIFSSQLVEPYSYLAYLLEMFTQVQGYIEATQDCMAPMQQQVLPAAQLQRDLQLHLLLPSLLLNWSSRLAAAAAAVQHTSLIAKHCHNVLTFCSVLQTSCISSGAADILEQREQQQQQPHPLASAMMSSRQPASNAAGCEGTMALCRIWAMFCSR